MTPLTATAQTEAKGRALFRDAGCTVCHAFEAKSGAPSLKQMKRTYEGNPQAVLNAIGSAPSHANDPSIKALPKDRLRQTSEWMSGAWSQSAASVTPAPPAKAASDSRDSIKARTDADNTVAAKKESNEKSRLAAQERDRRAAADQLALKRDAEAKAKLADELNAKREAEIQAAQKREATEIAKRAAEAAARNDLQEQSRLKREADDKARRAEADKLAREAEDKAARQKAADEAAQREASQKARREAEEQAALKREAEAKARKEAEAVAQKPPAAPTAVAKVDRESRPPMKAPDKFRDEPCPPPTGAPIVNVDEARAKAIMERIDCTGCHAYVQKKTGPPFKKVFEKVKGNPECVIKNLKNNKEHNDEGVTDELKPQEFKIVADYLATRFK